MAFSLESIKELLDDGEDKRMMMMMHNINSQLINCLGKH
jgi:hypothetical protein